MSMSIKGFKRDPCKDYYADLSKVRLGSKPFRGGVPYYIVRKEAFLSDYTIEENARKLFYFAKIFEDLYAAKRIKTTDPRHISREEIEAFFIWMKRQDLQTVTKKKYISVLDGYLSFFGNHIIVEMKRRNEITPVSKGEDDNIEFIEEQDLRKIFTHIHDLPGYRGIILRGYISLIFGIAGRPKEIIDARIEDLNLEDEIFYVRHPKGEGSWGKQRWVPIIRKDMIPILEAFLEERNLYLMSRNMTSTYLFPNPNTGAAYTNNAIRQMKKKVEESTGIQFKLKEFRSTYATITYAHSPEMKDAISKQMRHAKSATTDKYYIAYKQSEAAKRLKDEWKKSRMD